MRFYALKALLSLLVAFNLIGAASVLSAADRVDLGAGSYSTVLPDGCKALPDRIYKTADVAGPTVTGQWWSSLVW